MDFVKIGLLALTCAVAASCSKGNATSDANTVESLRRVVAALREKNEAAVEAIEKWRELHSDLKVVAGEVESLENEVERFRSGDNWRDIVPDLEHAMSTTSTEIGTLLIKASTAEMLSEDVD